MWLLDMFRPSKSAVTEEGVELPVPGGEAVDEIQMCERCQFKGQCKFENGCTSLRTSLLNRVRKLAKLRGTPTGDVHKAALRESVVGFGWKTISRRWKKFYRICGLENNHAVVRVISRSERDRRETTDEYLVEIPFVTLIDGSEMVDYTILKNNIVNRSSAWTPDK